MTLKIEIRCNNAAFDDEPATEIARILGVLSRRIQDGETDGGMLRDINGNPVGDWNVIDD